MELTRRCDYACRILRCSYRYGRNYVSIAQISEEEGVPYAFARSIQHDLAAAGFVETARGTHGGLRLAVDPSDVTLQDLLSALQGPVSVSPCTSDPDFCELSSSCAFHSVWQGADHLLNVYFSSLTLQDVFDGGLGCQLMQRAVESALAELQVPASVDVSGA